MTAEIGILNKGAVALAADSAVTGGNGQKIYNSVNKLFGLSEWHPVGIMVYGNAEVSGVPWEPIIKIYRKHLGKTHFATLDEYGKHFLHFLDANRKLFPEDLQRRFAYGYAFSFYREYLLDKIQSKVKEAFKARKKVSLGEVSAIGDQVIAQQHTRWENTPFLAATDESDVASLQAHYTDRIDEAIKDAFGNFPISPGAADQLRRIGFFLFTKDRLPRSISGIVIAGFGEDETFPSLVEYRVMAVVDDRARLKRKQFVSVEKQGTAIVPFAQADMAHTFIGGINPTFRSEIEGYLDHISSSLPAAFANQLGRMRKARRQEIQNQLKTVVDTVWNDLKARIEQHSREAHVQPILSAVDMLPKGELGEMAESLVNLTKLRQKVSMETETVGGPIDVAVISKGDGFVWIKRKHYFAAQLNPHFAARYLPGSREGTDEQTTI